MNSDLLHRIILISIISAVFIFGFSSAVSADDTVDVSPYMILNFSDIPDDIFDGSKISLKVSSEFSNDTLSILNSLNEFTVINAAYAVRINAENLNLTDVSKCCVYMPVSDKWNSIGYPVRAVVFSGDSHFIETPAVKKGNETVMDVYSVNLSEVPDSVILVFGNNAQEAAVQTTAPVSTLTPTPIPTASSVAVSSLLFGAAAAFLLVKGRK